MLHLSENPETKRMSLSRFPLLYLRKHRPMFDCNVQTTHLIFELQKSQQSLADATLSLYINMKSRYVDSYSILEHLVVFSLSKIKITIN